MISRNQWLLLVTAALSFYRTGNIWLVQLSSYRLWTYVGSREFQRYHVAWWHSIWGVIFVPAALVFLASILMLWMRPGGVPAWVLWLGLALQILIYVGTALWWGPLMARLASPETGLILPLYRLLMMTHWIRVALVKGYGLLAFWMMVKSLTATVSPG